MAQWFANIGGQRQGPVDSHTLRDWANQGRLKPSDLVWREGIEDWLPASKVKGLFDGVETARVPAVPDGEVLQPVAIIEPSPPAPRPVVPISSERPTVQVGRLNLAELRTPGESTLRVICLVFSILVYVVTFGIVALYAGMIMLMAFFALAVMLAEIRGNGIKVGPRQFPRIYESARRATEALGLDAIPEIYVIQSGGMLNAFATRWAFRRYVVLYSDLVDACGDDSAELDMIMAHEVGHLALGHLLWIWFILPARVIPFLGQAYSRACEYSADRCGMAGCGDPEAAKRGLLILAAGGKLARVASMQAFLAQRDQVRGFWQTVVEWIATHPWLTRRVEALHLFQSGSAQASYQPADDREVAR